MLIAGRGYYSCAVRLPDFHDFAVMRGFRDFSVLFLGDCPVELLSVIMLNLKIWDPRHLRSVTVDPSDALLNFALSSELISSEEDANKCRRRVAYITSAPGECE